MFSSRLFLPATTCLAIADSLYWFTNSPLPAIWAVFSAWPLIRGGVRTQMRIPNSPIIAGSNDLTARWARRSAFALLRQVAVSPSRPSFSELPLHALVGQLYQAPGQLFCFCTFCIRLLYARSVNCLRFTYDPAADYLRSAYSVTLAKSVGKKMPWRTQSSLLGGEPSLADHTI